MNPGAESGGYAIDILGTLASGLGVDAMESGRKALKVIRLRSPELVSMNEEAGEDIMSASPTFIEMLLASLRSDMEVPWATFDQRTREFGRLGSAQGVPLEALIDMLAVYRRATIELVSRPVQGNARYDEIIAAAQSRLENVTERLTTSLARGYLDHIDEEHRARESEMYGLAAIVNAMSRSLDVRETAEVALVESLAALRLSTGVIWLRERSSYKLAHTVGLDDDQVADFARQVGPQVKASSSAIGRSESQVDRLSSQDWNALRAQLRVKGRTIGLMTVATRVDRVFNASELLFMSAVADQVAIAVDRARQFACEARTDHLTGLANRREFERVMEREVALAERHSRRLAVMMIDLDNLKRINDRQGHRGGDDAIRFVAQQILRVVRASDVAARVGGDEFAVAMPETDLDRARDVATRLRQTVLNGALGMRSREKVEVSVGIAAWKTGQDWQSVYQAADTDLYADKRRRQTARRWRDDTAPASPIGLLARSGGRRRVSGA